VVIHRITDLNLQIPHWACQAVHGNDLFCIKYMQATWSGKRYQRCTKLF